MTACGKTIKERRGASLPRAFVLFIAGVLAVGLLPALAFAAPETEGADESAPIELQASDKDAWYAGAVTAAEDNLGNAIDPAGSIEFIADDTPHYVVPTEVTPFACEPIDLTAVATYFAYYEATLATYTVDGKDYVEYAEIPSANCYPVNDYVVVAYHSAADYDGSALYLKDGAFYKESDGLKVLSVEFSIAGQDISTMDMYQVISSDPEDFGDTDYIFAGGGGLMFGNLDGELNLTTGTEALQYGVDYDVDLFKIEGASKVAVGSALDVGQYEAVVTGLGKYWGSTAKYEFEVKPLDVAEFGLDYVDGVVGAWVEPTAGSLVYPYGAATTDQITAVQGAIKAVTYKSGPAGSEYTTQRFNVPGHFVYDVTLDSANADVKAGNIIGAATVEFDVAGEYVSYDKFFYGEDPLNGYVVNTALADDDPVFFDSGLITIKPAAGVTLDNSNIIITAFDYYTGDVVELDDILGVEGWYDVSIEIDPSTCDYKYTGICWMEVKVTMDHISDANVFITYDGQNIDFPDAIGPVEYDGTDWALLFSSEVKATDGTLLTEGTDYKVVLYYWDDLNGDTILDPDELIETTEFVDAGVYMYAVESEGLVYSVPSWAFVFFEIWPKEIYLDDYITSDQNYVEIMEYVDKTSGYPADYWLQYQDGAVIEPVFGFYFGDDNEYGEPIYESLDPSEYKVSLEKWSDDQGKWYASAKEIDEIAEPGWYRLTLEADLENASGNYDLINTFVAWIWVQDALTRFTDVDYDNGWYADYVTYVANTSNGAGVLMGGYAGTTIFGVGNTMLRSEVAQVLLNLAGQPSDPNAANMTPLKDVEDKMWYTTAINFAYGAGVITGYTSGDQAGNFGVYDNVSREQFATMLYRFAKTFAPSIYKEIDLDTAKTVLLNFDDGESVGDYAKPAMAWCIENGIMSGYSGTANLGPQDTILREQVAKMVAVFDQANKGVL